MDFLWHAVSEKEKEQIKKEAKQIMDSFSKKLAQVDKKMTEPLIEREKCERDEGSVKGAKIDRDIMFGNASNKDDDFIIGEKRRW